MYEEYIVVFIFDIETFLIRYNYFLKCFAKAKSDSLYRLILSIPSQREIKNGGQVPVHFIVLCPELKGTC